MLIVISQDRDLLCAAATCLSTQDLPSVIVAQNVGVALSLMEDNDVDAVLVHEPGLGNPMSRVVGRRFPEVACIPIATPADFVGLAARLRHRGGDEAAADAVVAHGVEELLGLLAMTRRAASIAVTAGHNYGSLSVGDGAIIDARIGDLEGREAALRILSWRDARLCARPPQPAVSGDLRLPISVALAEAARRSDELARLGSRADVDAALGRLDPLPPLALLLADTDNGTPDVQRGTRRQCEPRRLWHAARASARHGEGIALWDATINIVAMPVAPGRSLAVACGLHKTDGASPQRQRRRVTEAAGALSDIVADICAGDGASPAEREAELAAHQWG